MYVCMYVCMYVQSVLITAVGDAIARADAHRHDLVLVFAGRGVADSSSLVHAVLLAAQLAQGEVGPTRAAVEAGRMGDARPMPARYQE